jgi:hypothetical protein
VSNKVADRTIRQHPGGPNRLSCHGDVVIAPVCPNGNQGDGGLGQADVTFEDFRNIEHEL